MEITSLTPRQKVLADRQDRTTRQADDRQNDAMQSGPDVAVHLTQKPAAPEASQEAISFAEARDLLRGLLGDARDTGALAGMHTLDHDRVMALIA